MWVHVNLHPSQRSAYHVLHSNSNIRIHFNNYNISICTSTAWLVHMYLFGILWERIRYSRNFKFYNKISYNSFPIYYTLSRKAQSLVKIYVSRFSVCEKAIRVSSQNLLPTTYFEIVMLRVTDQPIGGSSDPHGS
jgi:hypothetical protein